MRLHNRSVERRLLWRPAMAVGEAYMDGSLTVDGGDVYPLLDLINRNTFRAGYNPLSRLHHTLNWPVRLLSGSNSLKRARRNAAYTYDLDAEFYRLFLDKHMQYTCAYFVTRDIALDDAQEEKMLHLGAKLLLKPGVKVLDIGCGWGNLAAFLAGLESLSVDGLTLSQEQLRDAERLAREKGVDSRVLFHLRDYRDEHGKYDRVVSVGMFEHVGVRHYGTYFKKIHDLLTEDGVAVVHFIGRMEPPTETAPWLNKYIFPGVYAPALSEVLQALKGSGSSLLTLRCGESTMHRLWPAGASACMRIGNKSRLGSVSPSAECLSSTSLVRKLHSVKTLLLCSSYSWPCAERPCRRRVTTLSFGKMPNDWFGRIRQLTLKISTSPGDEERQGRSGAGPASMSRRR